MSANAIALEEKRLEKIDSIDDYHMVHERHRIFPAVFEERNHQNVLDISAGIGIVGKRIRDFYDTNLWCNDISPTCLQSLDKLGINTYSFNLDKPEGHFPIPNENFETIVSLATIEHIIHIDHFVQEIHRILAKDGYLYISAPNYSGLGYLLPFLYSGKTFHNPMVESQKYEFYAHVRYFTYQSLLEFISSFGFTPIKTYVGLPQSSSLYLKLKSKSKFKAFAVRNMMKYIFKFTSPRWASEPVLCFKKGGSGYTGNPPFELL